MRPCAHLEHLGVGEGVSNALVAQARTKPYEAIWTVVFAANDSRWNLLLKCFHHVKVERLL